MVVEMRLERLTSFVVGHPGWLPILEGFGIDGRDAESISLAAAAERAGVDVDVVVAALSGARRPRYDCRSIAAAPVGAIIDHIQEVHHQFLRRELPRIAVLIDDAVRWAPEDDLLGAVDGTFRALRRDLEPHLAVEEATIFPLCRDIAEAFSWPGFHLGPVAHPIEILVHEHDHAIDALDELAWMAEELSERAPGPAAGALVQAIRGLDADLQRHFDEEHELLFPRTLRSAEELHLI